MTVSILQLWIPIIAGGLLAWVASGLIHMVIKYHNSDYNELSNEDEVMAALRAGSPSPKMYTVPFCGDMKNMGEESMQKKFADGPVAMIAVMPNGMPPMGKLMMQQISFFVVGNIFIAYVATLALAAGAEYMQVFRFIGAVGFLAYGWASIPYSIWYGHAWSTTAKYLLDALIYGLVVAGTFAWLWPAVS